MKWQLISEAKPHGLIVVFRWRGFYVGIVDDSGDYFTGKNLPDGYMGLMSDDLWLSIPVPVPPPPRPTPGQVPMSDYL